MALRVLVHLGVHKTGTTAFQRLMVSNKDAFQENNIVCKVRSPELNQFTRPFVKKIESGCEDLAPEFEYIKSLSQGRRGVLISDEDILGNLRPHAWDKLYPDAHKVVLSLKDMFSASEMMFLVSVRSYADYLNSCYIQRLKLGASDEEAAYTNFYKNKNCSWPEFVERIKLAAAPFPVKIFKYHSGVVSDLASTTADFLGIGRILDKTENKAANPSYSDVAIRIAKIANSELTSAGKKELRRFLERNFPRTPSDKFSVFSDEERAEMSERFSEDWKRLAGTSISTPDPVSMPHE